MRYMLEFGTRRPTPVPVSGVTEQEEALPLSGFIGTPVNLGRVFSAEQCQAIVQLGKCGTPVNAGPLTPIEGYRTGFTAEIAMSERARWLYEKVVDVIMVANQWYRFDIRGLIDRPLFCEYAPGDHFGWHVDCSEPPTATRKISISVQLSQASDYTGGGLEFAHFGEIEEARRMGTAVAFPAYVPHRVEAVTAGVRRSLVVWAHGPVFR